jgi:hypothetical protein
MILNNLSILPFYKVTTENPTPRDCERWWAYGNVWPLVTPGLPPMQIPGYVNSFDLMSWEPNWRDYPTIGAVFLQSKTIGGQNYDFSNEYVGSWAEGRYYLATRIGGEYYVSDVFTIVPSFALAEYLKIEWWDDEDLVLDSGAIVYTNSAGVNAYKNTLYLPTDIAKPEYIFEEEGETRDGYFFPIKQISEKRYHFRFLAPEYILDVMRLIRMSDHIVITYKGQEFYPDTFLMTPTWEGDGQLANVECEFDTDTVAKKIGRLVTI